MTSITNLFTPYSSLTDDKKTSGNASLADLLNGTGQSPTSGTGLTAPDTSYLVNLSEEARNYLAGQSSKPSGGTTGASFLLSDSQQQKLDSLIEKYKDAPFTQESFDAMLTEIELSGIGPQELSAKEQAKLVNPTALFLGALNGSGSGLAFSSANNDALKTRADNYLQSIYDQWESISTTVEEAE